MSSLRHSPFVSPRAGIRQILPALLLGLAVWGLVAPVAQADTANHLVISEFSVITRNPVSTFGSPFIEVMNPTAEAIDLSRVYLTDGTTGTSAAYYNIALRDVAAANPGGGGLDFHAKFPEGFTLPAGAAVVISLNGSTEFFSAFGRQPDFEMFEDAAAPDLVPEMEPAFPGAISGGPFNANADGPELSTTTESLVLYQWDGQSDDVQDLDYVFWGSNESVRVNKTGITIGSHVYLDDTPVGEQDPANSTGPTFGQSLQRLSADEGSEVLTGGNGLTGHDETSENLSGTWAIASPSDPADDLATAFPAAPIVTLLAKGTAIDGAPISVTANVQDAGTVTAVAFFYSVDGAAYVEVAGSSDDGLLWNGTIPAQAQDAVVDFYCTATNANGGTAIHPAGAPSFVGARFTVQSPFSGPQKLLITEVAVGPNIYPFTGMAQIAPEFIEIHNPNDFEVDLSNYHLTDALRYDNEYYWRIADGLLTQGDIGGGHYNDFVARFPAGSSLEAGQTITVSMAGSYWFQQAYSRLPDYEMYEDGDAPDDIPDMEPVFENPASDLEGNSIITPGRDDGGSSDLLPKGLPELEEHYGEPLVLYYFSPGDDKVVDVDIFIWGEARTGQFGYGFQKGPLANNGSDDYANDTPLNDQDWYAGLDESGTVSYTRIDAAEGTQIMTGGNGVGGRDETSENLSDTWTIVGPTPGVFLAGGGDDIAGAILNIPARTFNPVSGEAFPIELVAPDGSEVRLRLFDREGRLVKTLWDSRFEGPVSSFVEFPSLVDWDGRDSTYELVKAGMYILHLSVVNQTTGEEETQTAPVVVATRLSN